jgi:hypothetical protein
MVLESPAGERGGDKEREDKESLPLGLAPWLSGSKPTQVERVSELSERSWPPTTKSLHTYAVLREKVTNQMIMLGFSALVAILYGSRGSS